MGTTWDELNDLFHQALTLAPAERESFVRRSLPDRREQQTELLRMLVVATGTGHAARLKGDVSLGLLNPRPESDSQQPARDHDVALDVSGSVGDYQLLKLLGEGGMGRVYLARHQQTADQVAIKLLRQDRLVSKNVLQRFDIERQLLAMLKHDHIAALLDVGQTENGEPYLVMEYVDGQRITDHCSAARLSISNRLRLFQAVLSAVAHAHGFGIVHRDLKPSNILVTLAGVPKLVDFGVAKVFAPVVIEDFTTLTIDGAPPMTPEYASPEQLGGRPASVASDVYSLGIVLYEMLTGLAPYQFVTRSPIEIAQVVCQNDPLRPSVALKQARSASTSLGTATSTARGGPGEILGDNRRSPTRWSTRQTRMSGDLDAIVLKAIRKEPQLRYRSADEFSEDIDRYFQGRPVLARKGNRTYVIGRFLRRHALTVGSSVVLLLALVLALIATRRALRRETLAVAETQQVVLQKELAIAEADIMTGHPGLAYQVLSRAGRRAAADQPEWELRYLYGRLLALTDLKQLQGMRELPGAGDIILRHAQHRDWVFFGSRLIPGSHSEPAIRGWRLERALAGEPQSDLLRQPEYFRTEYWLSATCSVAHDRLCYFLPGGPGVRHNSALVLAELSSGRELDRLDANQFVDLPPGSGPGPLMISPDGQRLVCIHACGRLTLWSLVGDRLSFEGADRLDESGGYAARFSPAGDAIASYSVAGSISICSTSPFERVCKIPDRRLVTALDWCPDGLHVIAGDSQGNVWVYQVPAGKQIAAWNEGQAVACLDTAADGQRVVTVCADGSARVRAVADGGLLHKFQGAVSTVTDVEWLDQDRALAICTVEQNARIWPLPTVAGRVDPHSNESSVPPTSWQSSEPPVTCIFTHPQEDLVGIGNDRQIHLWRVATGECVQSFEVTANAIFSAEFVADSRQIMTHDVSAGEGMAARLWDGTTGRELRKWLNADDVTVHRRLPLFAIISSVDRQATLGRTTDWVLTTPVSAIPNGLRKFEFANQSPIAATATEQGEIGIFDVSGESVQRRHWIEGAHPACPEHLVFSPDDRLLVSVAAAAEVAHVWDVQTGQRLKSIQTHTVYPIKLSFSPNGRRLSIVGDDGRIRLFDPQSGILCYESPVATTPDTDYAVAHFSPDGESLLAINRRGVLSILPAISPAEFRAGLTLVERTLLKSGPNGNVELDAR